MKTFFDRITPLIILPLLIISGCTKYYDKGLNDYKKGNYQEAIEDCEKAINKNPNDDMAYALLSDIYRDYKDAPLNRESAYDPASRIWV